MAQPTMIPHHVTALLTHLTSRPGVQSTLILSRKDGSIIQSTGALGAELAARQSQSRSADMSAQGSRSVAQATSQVGSPGVAEAASGSESEPVSEDAPATVTPTSEGEGNTDTVQQQSEGQEESREVLGEQQQQQQKAAEEQQQFAQTQGKTHGAKDPYQPTHAEALAAHIFAFVSSASELSLSLSHPPDSSGGSRTPKTNGSNGRNGVSGGVVNGVMSPTDETESQEKEQDDEVKLLRLRTRKHEIVVVPDRKYLLCVVQDASGVGGRR